MSGYVGAGSTSHLVNKMYVGVSGQAKAVQKAYIGVDGKAKLWYQLGKPISNYNVGNTVKFKVNNVSYDWIIVHKGKPSGDYDMPNDAIILMMNILYAWDNMLTTSGGTCYSYNDSQIHNTYLNGTFLNWIEPAIRNSIIQVKIPYYNNGSGKVLSGSSGLSAKVFIPSASEIDAVQHNDPEGVKWSYFQTDAGNRRIAYYQGNRESWWTRSRRLWWIDHKYSFTTVRYDGGYEASDASSGSGNKHGIRPCIVVPASILVDDKGYIIGA